MLEDYIKASNKMEHIVEQFMADTTPVTKNDIPELLNIAEKLKNGDTSLNPYTLYKHPKARAKLFSQIAEACCIKIGMTLNPLQRLEFINQLEESYKNILIKNLQRSDKQNLRNLIEYIGLPKDLEERMIKDNELSSFFRKKE